MRRRVLLDEIVRQLMAHRDPPVTHRINSAIPIRLKLRQVQLLKPHVVEEECAGLVERDRGAAVVVEYVQRLRADVEDRSDVEEEKAEEPEAIALLREEVVAAGHVIGDVEFDARICVAEE